MQDDEILSSLIGDIYDAALEPSLWPTALSKAADFVGGQAAGVLSKDAISQIGDAHHHVGIDDQFLKLYQETHWQFDPMGPLYFFAVGEVTSQFDYISDQEFREGRFYREWCAPQGWINSATVVLEKSAASFAVLSFLRSDERGVVDDDMRRRVRIVFPHVRRSVLIGKTIDLKTTATATLAEALDAISASLFLIDAQGRAVHANAAGRALLALRHVLSTVNGRITAIDAEADSALGAALASAREGDKLLGGKGIAVPLSTADGEYFVAHLLPLTSGGRRRANLAHGAIAALFVHKAGLQAPSMPEVLAKTFALTPSELRVLLATIQVESTSGIAESLGVSENTVHTHLRRLFDKTGTRRQAELIKLVAGFSNSPVK